MPLRQYFVWVGSILLVMLFAAEVVFDTTRSRLTPAAGVSPEPHVLPSQNLAQAEQHGPLEAFAAMKAGD